MTGRKPRRGLSERKLRAIVMLGGALMRALASTWRVRIVNAEPYLELVRSGKPVIFTFWHGEMLPLMFQHVGQRVALLISEHQDGEIIARIGRTFGYTTVRGSTSRGAGRALLGLIRALESGSSVAVTPDGPRGPARTFAAGAVIAAQRANAAIIPSAASADRAWQLRSWDRFLIPKPFARVTVVYGDPAYVEATSTRDAHGEIERFQRLLDETGAAARA